MERGVITNWEDMEEIWRYTFSELHAVPEEQPVFLTETPLNPKNVREKMAQIMFETFSAPALYLSITATLCLHNGNATCVVLESGDGVTHAVPVYMGAPIIHGIQRIDFAGSDITHGLMKTLMPPPRSDIYTYCEAARIIKERLGYVALDFERELAIAAQSPASQIEYRLPDGQAVTITGADLFRIPEALFRPAILGIESMGVHEMIHQSIAKCDADLQCDLYRKIMLMGANTMFRGIGDRMQREMTALAPPGVKKVVIYASPFRNYSAWIGASILASLSTFQNLWVSKQEYEETGPGIIHQS